MVLVVGRRGVCGAKEVAVVRVGCSSGCEEAVATSKDLVVVVSCCG